MLNKELTGGGVYRAGGGGYVGGSRRGWVLTGALTGWVMRVVGKCGREARCRVAVDVGAGWQ